MSNAEQEDMASDPAVCIGRRTSNGSAMNICEHCRGKFHEGCFVLGCPGKTGGGRCDEMDVEAMAMQALLEGVS